MSDRAPRPSRVLLWVLERVSSRHAARAAVGDIFEELDARTAEGRAPWSASLWLSAAVVGAVIASLRLAVPRGLRALGHTLRDAARALRRSPKHALFILLVLALAISAATVTFSVVDAVVLRPLPFEHSESIVRVMGRHPASDWPTGLKPEQFWAVHDQVTAFESFASLRRSKVPITDGAVTGEAQVMRSTAALFKVFALEPALGRLWTTEEETSGDATVAVLSFRFWQRWFAGNPSVLGRTVTIEKQTYRVVGVLPATADRMDTMGWAVDAWVPDVPPRVTTPGRGAPILALGRLRPGVSREQAAAQVHGVLSPAGGMQPGTPREWRPEVVGWQASMIGNVRGWMLLVLGAVALIVIIGCINAANVMLTRSTDRARELAVRASLGASRRQIALSLVAESLMLSTAASVCALAFAWWGARAVKGLLPMAVFRADTIAVNGRVMTMSILAAIVTGLLFGTAPAWIASRVSIVGLIKDGGPTSTAGRSRWRSALLAAQIGCITVLLVISALFVASFVRVVRADLGIDRSSLLGIASHTTFRGTVDEVEQRLKTVPGVVDVAVVTYTSLPLVASVFGGAYGDTKLRPADGASGESALEVLVYRVTPNYFAVTGLPFRRGSTWSAAVAVDSTPLVIDEVAARRLFGDRDPLGLRVTGDDLTGVFTIVGVVPFVRSRGPEDVVQPSVYVPITPNPARKFAGLFVRTSKPPDDVLPVVQGALADIGPVTDRPYVHLVDEAFRRLTATRRFNATLMSSFALFAMLIGAAGIYGVMASLVAQRTREFGVRIALGASASDIRRGLLAQVGRHLVFGLALGLPAAWWISRGFGALFFEVRPTDVSIYLIVVTLLAAVAVVAALVPARRASRVDPIVSLRAS